MDRFWEERNVIKTKTYRFEVTRKVTKTERTLLYVTAPDIISEEELEKIACQVAKTKQDWQVMDVNLDYTATKLVSGE